MIELTTKKPPREERYPKHIDRIVIALLNSDYIVSRRDAEDAWYAYSDDMCAGWMNVPEERDEYIVNTLLDSYLVRKHK